MLSFYRQSSLTKELILATMYIIRVALLTPDQHAAKMAMIELPQQAKQ